VIELKTRDIRELINSAGDRDYEHGEFYHDALCAHAYQQALQEASDGVKDFTYASFKGPANGWAKWVNNRAAEIIESWLKGEKT
jgi:hypothetical protein